MVPAKCCSSLSTFVKRSSRFRIASPVVELEVFVDGWDEVRGVELDVEECKRRGG